MRVGITGSRHGLTPWQRRVAVDLLAESQITELHHGDCRGADTDVMWLAVQLGAGGVLHTHPATMSPSWDEQWQARSAASCPELGIVEHEPLHPLARNKRIVESVDLVWGFPDLATPKHHGGTWHTLRHASRRCIPFLIVTPAGEVRSTLEEPF